MTQGSRRRPTLWAATERSGSGVIFSSRRFHVPGTGDRCRQLPVNGCEDVAVQRAGSVVAGAGPPDHAAADCRLSVPARSSNLVQPSVVLYDHKLHLTRFRAASGQ